MRWIFLSFILVFATSSFSPSEKEKVEIHETLKLWELSPEEFFAKKEVKEEINLGQPDNYLLSIAVYQATNALRNKKGLTEFIPDLSLHKAGALHIDEMVKYDFFDHVNPYNRENRTLGQRIENQGGSFSLMAENLALLPPFDTDSNRYRYRKNGRKYKFFDMNGKRLKIHTYESFAKEVVYEWYKSEGHRHNLFNPELSHIGIAVHIEPFYYDTHIIPAIYAVQEFGAL